MPPKFQIIEVPDNLFPKLEQMGTKFKFWYFDEQYGYCLFKEGHPNTGEDWAERVAAELCALLGMPHAVYKLAVWRSRRGVITQNFLADGESYSAGNEVLFRQDASYPKAEKKAKKHSIENISSAFELLKVQIPKEAAPPNITTAKQVFLGYLMLDAWISNTDRHHENWATIRHFDNEVLTDRLAPTHDHAASLGCILQDDEKRERLTTKDTGGTVEAYVVRSKARSAIYANEADAKPLSLIDAFRAASSLNPQASEIWLEKLENVTIDAVKEIFERIPEERISDISKEFAIRMLEINRQRLLKLKR
ncbi:MAG: HipA-like protein [Acidobacteriota bacterium]|nr:HipA-like protein [Acidobacteriota bacterium]